MKGENIIKNMPIPTNFGDVSNETVVMNDEDFIAEVSRDKLFKKVKIGNAYPVYWHSFVAEDLKMSKKITEACMILRGIDVNGKKVAMIIRNIRPFFYVSVPNDMTPQDVLDKATDGLSSYRQQGVTASKKMMFHYHGFQTNKSPYIRISAPTLSARNALITNIEKFCKTRRDVFFGEADKGNAYANMYLRHNLQVPVNTWSMIPRDTQTTDDLYFRDGVYSKVWLVSEYPTIQGTCDGSDPCLLNSWDIETKKLGNDMVAPRPLENPNEAYYFYISAISSSISIWHEKAPKLVVVFTHIAVLEEHLAVEGKKPPLVVVSENEEEMMMTYYRFLDIIRPEYETAFNGGRFDWPVMFCKVDSYSEGCLVNLSEPCTVKDWMMKYYCDTKDPSWTHHGKSFDAAYKKFTEPQSLKMEAGINEKFVIPSFPGVTSFDAMVPLVKAYSNIEDKRLDTFLQRAGLGSKEDMDYIEMHRVTAIAEIFAKGQEHDVITITDDNGNEKDVPLPLMPMKIRPRKTVPGHADDICRFLFYSYIDALKLSYLMHKEGIIMTRRALAALGMYNIQSAFSRPDGAILMNLLSKRAFDDHRVMHNGYKKSSESKTIKYFGAYVVPPVHGLHNDRPVTGIDFSSLYPSLMMTYNLSPDMIVREEDVPRLEKLGYKILRLEIPYRLKVGAVLDDPNVPVEDVPSYEEDEMDYVYLSDDDEDDDMPTRKAVDEYVDKTFVAYILQHNGIHDPVHDKKIITNTFKEMTWKIVLERNAEGKPTKYGETFMLPKVAMADTVEAHTMANEVLGNESLSKDIEYTSKIIYEYGRDALPGECMGVNARAAQYLFNLRKQIKKPLEAVASIIEKLEATDGTSAMWEGSMTSIQRLREIREKLNAQQLAIKILANSIYGKSGQEALYMFSIAVAAGITYTGQMFATRPMKEFVINVMGCTVVYGDTDSLYVKCPDKIYADIYAAYSKKRLEAFGIPETESFYNHTKQLSQAEVALKVSDLWTPMVHRTRKYIAIITDVIADRLCHANGTRFLTMAYEEVAFPTYLGGKKKYTLVPHEREINFFPKKFFIRGFDFKKRGSSAISRKIGERILKEVLHPGFHGDTMGLINNILDTFMDNKNVDDFIIYGTYRPTKKSSATNIRNAFSKRFEEACRVGDEYMKLMYTPALPGETFPYVLVNKNNGWTIDGRRVNEDKVSNLVEPYELVKQNPSMFKINHPQYIAKMKGFLSRFIIANEAFKEDLPENEEAEDDDDYLDMVDKFLAKKATKYILDRFKKISGGDRIQESAKMARAVARRLDDDDLAAEIVSYLSRVRNVGRSSVTEAAIIAAIEDYLNDGYTFTTMPIGLKDIKTRKDVDDYYDGRFKRYEDLIKSCFDAIHRCSYKTSDEELAKGILMSYLCGDYIIHRDRPMMMNFVRLIRVVKARDYEKCEKRHVLETYDRGLKIKKSTISEFVEKRSKHVDSVYIDQESLSKCSKGLSMMF